MSAVEGLLSSIDRKSAFQLAAESRKANSGLVTADVRPNPRVGSSGDVGFVGNRNSSNTAVARILAD